MRNLIRTQAQPLIGLAWAGKHVVIIHCSANNEFINLYKSLHAPIEPTHPNCAETLSQLLSIGYRIYAITPITVNLVQYVLVL